MYTKGFLHSNFTFKAVIDKISNFHEIAPNFTNSQKSYFLSINSKKEIVLDLGHSYKQVVENVYLDGMDYS